MAKSYLENRSDNVPNLVIPPGYKSELSIRETEIAIKTIKDNFELELANELNLVRVSAPLFVFPSSGMNDNLNGTERPVKFDLIDMSGYEETEVEIIHSLAKWKRSALSRYGFECGDGLYTDMNAIRRDETFDNLHSIYVDQWDWESVIEYKDRTLENLKSFVRKIYKVFQSTDKILRNKNEKIRNTKKMLPDDIFFITAQQLYDRYPNLTPKQRENAITKEYGAVCLMQIGGLLSCGESHDGRAPDYDDWQLNCDILFWYPVLECAFEVSSMGIRVDENSLKSQLAAANCEERANLSFHRELFSGKLPYTIGGGIGQSRICMFFLSKAHIGEVQASVWPEDMITECANNGIYLL